MSSLTRSGGAIIRETTISRIPVATAAADPRLDVALERLDALAQGVQMANQTANAILSAQDIARRFETTREEILARVCAHEVDTAVAIDKFDRAVASRLATFEATLTRRVETLEALSFGTLVRLLVRRILGR
jgi:hypothetical protein